MNQIFRVEYEIDDEFEGLKKMSRDFSNQTEAEDFVADLRDDLGDDLLEVNISALPEL